MVARIRPGDIVSVQGPFGSFVIDQRYDRNIIFLAGGIGITPFISMARYAAQTQLPIPITLLYTCSDAADIPFLDELLELEQRNPRLRVAFFIGKGNTSQLPESRITRGRITKRHLVRITGDAANRFTYFLCGPPGFMNGMQTMLADYGVDDERIIVEAFSQGKQKNEDQKAPGRLTYALASLLVLVGVSGIAGLDLVRAVPKIAASQMQAAASQASTGTSSPSVNSMLTAPPSTTASAPSLNSSANTSGGGMASSGGTSPSSSSASGTNTHTVYQPPVSTVS